MERRRKRMAILLGTVAGLAGLAVGNGLLAAGPAVKRVVERVSVGPGGAQATGPGQPIQSGYPAISADGRFIAFESDTTNLVPGDTNGLGDIFVRDRITGTTERVSVGPGGAQGTGGHSVFPAISADGRVIAFESRATNLVSGDTNNTWDIFVRDRIAGTTERISVGLGGVEATNSSYGSAISADGRFIAFPSSATNLVAGDTNNLDDVFVRDRIAGTTERVSVGADGAQATGGGSGYPAISADGRFIAFESGATNLVPGDTNNTPDIFVRDRVTGTTERVNLGPGGAQAGGGGGGLARGVAISGDGNFIAFPSLATNLVPGDTNATFDIFVRDRITGTTERVSVATGGAEASGSGGGIRDVAISADGRFIAFPSSATNLVPGDTNGTGDIFVRDRVAGTTERVSVGPGGVQAGANLFATNPAISADGRTISFASSATNLVPGDTNGQQDIFVTSRAVIPPTRIAVFRPATREWFARDEDGTTASLAFGGPGDRPVPADYFGFGSAQIAIFRPSTREWFLRGGDASTNPIQIAFGGPGDEPVPADYLGTGRAQIAVFRPSSGDWFLRNDDGTATVVGWGTTGDRPVPADYFGLGLASIAVYRPGTGQWFLRTSAGSAVVAGFGGPGDVPVPGDYLGLGRASLALFRPGTGEWFLRTDNGQTVRIPFGAPNDVPVPGDYLELGRMQLAVFRPGTGEWFVRESGLEAHRVAFGGPGDEPIPVPFRPRF